MLQTRSGKTHTLHGTKEDPGVAVRALSHVFAAATAHASLDVSITMLEIYNDTLHDLLAESEASGSARAPESGPPRRKSLGAEVAGGGAAARRKSLGGRGESPTRLELRSDATGARVVGACPCLLRLLL